MNSLMNPGPCGMDHSLVLDRVQGEMITIEDIITAAGGRMICCGPRAFTEISIDSRKISEGQLFIALKGERFDGHDFLREALQKGSGAIVSQPIADPMFEKTIIQVENTLKALQAIAHHARWKRDIPVIAVTGSNGKTTTKELIALILSMRYRILKNTGNLNNHVGLPLSLARISDEDEIVVLEMGASAKGEIRELCEVAGPDCGVLTNISPTHLEGFRDLETVRKTKLEMLDFVSTAVVNADDIFMMEGLKNSGFQGKLITYGIYNPADTYATDIRLRDRGSSFVLHMVQRQSIALNPNISGMFNIYNILAAATVGELMNVAPAAIQNAVDVFTGVPMRLEFREQNGIAIISDVYNANPASMEEAIKELVRIRKRKAIAVLGDMLELGSYEEDAHRKIGRLMAGLPVDIFLAVGKRMAYAAAEFPGIVYRAQNSAEAGEILKNIWHKGDTVLIKGSRGMLMEKVLEE